MDVFASGKRFKTPYEKLRFAQNAVKGMFEQILSLKWSEKFRSPLGACSAKNLSPPSTLQILREVWTPNRPMNLHI